MSVRITPDGRTATLQGVLAALDAGVTGNAQVWVYPAPKPTAVTDSVGFAPLVIVDLTRPSGTIASAQLTLTQSSFALISVSGVAVWGRLETADGKVICDLDVSDLAGSGDIKMESTTLFAGGTLDSVSMILG